MSQFLVGNDRVEIPPTESSDFWHTVVAEVSGEAAIFQRHHVIGRTVSFEPAFMERAFVVARPGHLGKGESQTREHTD